jgi:hypothetical protein
MRDIIDTMMTFGNIEEIKFTKIRNNVFSLHIKSDIDLSGKELENTTFEAQLCKIDPILELKLGKDYTDVKIHDDFIMRSESLSIPMNIQILLDNKLDQFFTITKE